jgi:hypothetical protein
VKDAVVLKEVQRQFGRKFQLGPKCRCPRFHRPYDLYHQHVDGLQLVKFTER